MNLITRQINSYYCSHFYSLLSETEERPQQIQQQAGASRFEGPNSDERPSQLSWIRSRADRLTKKAITIIMRSLLYGRRLVLFFFFYCYFPFLISWLIRWILFSYHFVFIYISSVVIWFKNWEKKRRCCIILERLKLLL